MKSVEGTLAGVREKTTEVLTEAEQTVNNDSVRSALITITLLIKSDGDNNANTSGTIGMRGDSDLIAQSLLNLYRSNYSFQHVIKKMLIMNTLHHIMNPDDDCDRDCEHCEEHSTHVN